MSFGIYPIDLISKQNYESDKWMGMSKAEDLVIIHGNEDTTIPIDQARKLYSVAKMNKEFEEVSGAGHNNIYLFDKAQEIIQKFLD